MAEWIRFLAGAVCILIGICFACTAVYGVYKFHFVMNRMHAAALGDSLGMLFIMLGCVLFNGWNLAVFKYILVVLFFFLAGPVSTHLIARLELTIDEEMKKECEEEVR